MKEEVLGSEVLHADDTGLRWLGVVVPQTIEKLRVRRSVGDHVTISKHKLLPRIDLEASELRRRVVEVRIVGMDSHRHGRSEIRWMIQNSDANQLAVDCTPDVTPTSRRGIAVRTRLTF